MKKNQQKNLKKIKCKKYILAMYLVLIGNVSVFSFPVEIISDSGMSILYYIDSIGKYLQVIQNGGQALETQIKALEKLDEGGYEGFEEYLKLQTSAISSFGETLNGLNIAQFFDQSQFSDVFNNTDWMTAFSSIELPIDEIEKGLEEMGSMFNELVSLTSNTKYFADNIQDRIQKLDSLVNMSKSAESPVAQSEIILQALSLIAAQNEDQIQLGMNRIALDGNKNKIIEQTSAYFSKLAKDEMQKESVIAAVNPQAHYENDIQYYQEQSADLWNNALNISNMLKNQSNSTTKHSKGKTPKANRNGSKNMNKAR